LTGTGSPELTHRGTGPTALMREYHKLVTPTAGSDRATALLLSNRAGMNLVQTIQPNRPAQRSGTQAF